VLKIRDKPGLTVMAMANPAGRSASADDGVVRRDFLYLGTGALGAVGAAVVAWPFIHSMNPAADALALATTDVNLTPIAEGQAITVVWRGKPVFVRHRTAQEIEAARRASLDEVKGERQTDQSRVRRFDNREMAQWLVVVGVCTHLGCVPTGQKPMESKGDYGGWFCPCHGSHYDTSGRIRRGPAPRNLEVPSYQFLNATTIRIG
jgi:ubiquinol-cytochrome c reductase iron-sulfur subunit